MTTPPPKKLLALDDQTIRYGDRVVLDEINLHLHAGERIVLLGKSGAGKSTLLKHLHKTLIDNNETIAWIPQQLGLVDNLSCFHNVIMGRLDQQSWLSNLRNLVWPSPHDKKAIQILLDQLSLKEFLFTDAGTLSGGQQQRIAIARALYRHSSILLADEPISGLDKPMAKKVLMLLKQHFGSCVIALHDIDLALTIADRIIGIREGQIVLDAAPSELDEKALAPLYLEAVHTQTIEPHR